MKMEHETTGETVDYRIIIKPLIPYKIRGKTIC